MTRTFEKLAVALVFGLVAAISLPLVKAVSAHRAEQSTVLGVQQVLSERGAGGSWMDGRYRFEIIERTVADRDGHPSSIQGYAVAWKASCDGAVCTPTSTWRGDLSVEGSERTIVTFDGLGRAAAFSGVLYEQGTGTACRFDVQWGGSSQAGGVVPATADSFSTDRVGVTGEPRTVRSLDRVIVAAPTCWPTSYNPQPFTAGTGSVFTAGA